MRGFRNNIFHCCLLVVTVATVSAFDTVQKADHVPSSYVLGPDDLISVRVLQAPEVAEQRGYVCGLSHAPAAVPRREHSGLSHGLIARGQDASCLRAASRGTAFN